MQDANQNCSNSQYTMLFNTPDLDPNGFQELPNFLDSVIHPAMPFEDKLSMFRSLLAMVKADFPFDDALQSKAVLSPHGFTDSIEILLSTPHQRIVLATLSFLHYTIVSITFGRLIHLIDTDLIHRIHTALQSHALRVSSQEQIFIRLNWILTFVVSHVDPDSLRSLHLSSTSEINTLREQIFQKVIVPSSLYLHTHIKNRAFFPSTSSSSFLDLLNILVWISVYHLPSLKLAISLPIPFTFARSFSFDDTDWPIRRFLWSFSGSLTEWEEEGGEAKQNGAKLMQALWSEGMLDELELLLMDGNVGRPANVADQPTEQILNLLGRNVLG
ncbi:hypothetical protein BLNAU_4967 [Blattamonas nauphoetae]|uniref:Uncharacterized protein n=1 Tax=Blattamonas nauphoetae TaxID=2049346 RepID=A0ABQ9Y8Q6_9EUKA|nr:hypothetical protein BLNAU_4967 [Blattamonas nauphoetae]